MKDLFGTAKYTIDACSLNDLMREDRRKFARRHFKTLWERMEEMFKGGELISHIEVYEEILDGGYEEQIEWIKENKHIFRDYDLPAEGNFIASLGKDEDGSVFMEESKRQIMPTPGLSHRQKSITSLSSQKKPRRVDQENFQTLALSTESGALTCLG